jgi:hypothetical protein
MNKKNKDIEKMLFGYAESNKPDLKITIPAKIKLSEKRRKISKFKFYKFAGNAAAVVCILFAIVISFQLFVFKNKSNDNVDNSPPMQVEIVKYNPEDIYITKASYENIQDYAPWVSNSINYEVYKYSKKNDATQTAIMYYISTRVKTDSGYAEIKFYIELTKEYYSKLYDLQKIDSFDKINDIQVKNCTAYIDGEYMSNAFFEKDNVKYYLDLMSNTDEALYDFLRLITN